MVTSSSCASIRHSAGAVTKSCRKLLAQLATTKNNILNQFRSRVEPHSHVLELALNEAEGLAWQTGYPHLVFPTLAMEKARAVADWHTRQQRVQERPLLTAFA